MMPYGNISGSRLPQAMDDTKPITWTNVGFSLVMFCGIDLGAISLWVPPLLLCIMSLKIILLKFLSLFLRANELLC